MTNCMRIGKRKTLSVSAGSTSTAWKTGEFLLIMWKYFVAVTLLLLCPYVINANEANLDCSSAMQHRFTVLTLNIAHGRGNARNQWFLHRDEIKENLKTIAHSLNAFDLDLVALQEVDAPSRWSGRFDHLEYLQQQASLNHTFHGLHASSFFFRFGTAFLSRQPLTATHSQRFSPSRPSLRKGFATAVVDWNVDDGKTVAVLNVVSVHFDFLRQKVRQQQASELIAWLEILDGPLVVMGDFNSTWDDRNSTVRLVAGALDLQAFEPGSDRLLSFRRMGTRLDWILISKNLRFRRYIRLPAVLSDHDAVVAELSLANTGDECDNAASTR